MCLDAGSGVRSELRTTRSGTPSQAMASGEAGRVVYCMCRRTGEGGGGPTTDHDKRWKAGQDRQLVVVALGCLGREAYLSTKKSTQGWIR